jgi:hypothetical protein
VVLHFFFGAAFFVAAFFGGAFFFSAILATSFVRFFVTGRQALIFPSVGVA